MGPLALLGIGAGISAVGNIVNNLMSRSNAQFAYDKFNSPAAQVRGFQWERVEHSGFRQSYRHFPTYQRQDSFLPAENHVLVLQEN